MREKLKKTFTYLRKRGIREFSAHALEKIRDASFDYNRWLRQKEFSRRLRLSGREIKGEKRSKLHVFAFPGADLQRTLRSIGGKTYRELGSFERIQGPDFARELSERIRKIPDRGICVFLREGDLLSGDAFSEILKAMSGSDFVYADEDIYEIRGEEIRYRDPFFKPDYSPAYLQSMNYIGPFFALRAESLKAYFREAPFETSSSAAFLYDLVLFGSFHAERIRHLPEVLRHAFPEMETGRQREDREDREDRQGFQDESSAQEMIAALKRDLKRRGFSGSIERGPSAGTFHVRYDLCSHPRVSLIIPNKDGSELLRDCLFSILSRSSWDQLEILVLENNSQEEETRAFYREAEEIFEKEKAVRPGWSFRILEYKGPFNFSRIVNLGVEEAQGDYVLLLNNDVSVLSGDWIERLLAQCQLPDVYAAGPLLLYPDGSVQSAGITIGLMGFAGSMMVQEDPKCCGGRKALLCREMSGLTAACMMVKRSAYLEIGGFDPSFSVALNDVDFCLRLSRGWGIREGEGHPDWSDSGRGERKETIPQDRRIVYEPSAVLIHYESKTRGLENTPEKRARFEKEKALFQRRWAHLLRAGDPFYNPNLSRRRCDYSQQT